MILSSGFRVATAEQTRHAAPEQHQHLNTDDQGGQGDQHEHERRDGIMERQAHG
jgi:hypothetical protein